MDRQIALWLLSCTCATYESLRCLNRPSKSELKRHRSIIETAYKALMNEGPMPPRSSTPGDMEQALKRAERCLYSEAA